MYTLTCIALFVTVHAHTKYSGQNAKWNNLPQAFLLTDCLIVTGKVCKVFIEAIYPGLH